MQNMLRKKLVVAGLFCGLAVSYAQDKALVDTHQSPFAKLHGVDMGAVRWTEGFWADRFAVCAETMVPLLWDIYTDPEISHAFRNFEIAAGIHEGDHRGPSFHDGDFYKTIEAVCGVYALTEDERLAAWLDEVIPVIAACQRADGYIYTKATIDERNSGKKIEFQDRLSFEAYNIGHLMTAACTHYRVTGKRGLLDIATKAADYLYGFYKQSNPTLARNAICPSHYMGTIELYRTTGDPRYLELANHLIDIKGEIDDGTDDNQDRVPFRQQDKAIGHAVRATYLYAGVTDLFAETGDTTLLGPLNRIWDDLISHKLYVTGGCGALYDGVSPDGTSYSPAVVQKVHQAFGRDYQLPNFTAHNETCANIGNVLWNWRMLLITGDAKYADIMELALYNSVLSGVSLAGDGFLYTNPLSYSDRLPFEQRWSKKRVPYISKSNCCPPNTVRTVAEVVNYAYSLSDEGVWFNLYGGSTLSTTVNGEQIALTQSTAYPWDGIITVKIETAPSSPTALHFRIPGWCNDARLVVNGQPVEEKLTAGTYAVAQRAWKAGDEVQLQLDMPVVLLESHPFVEETRNQVAVKRGPVVYCLEEAGIPEGVDVFDLSVPRTDAELTPEKVRVGDTELVVLQGNATQRAGEWDSLYRPIQADEVEQVPIQLVPYFAWGNREFGDMSVWLPISR